MRVFNSHEAEHVWFLICFLYNSSAANLLGHYIGDEFMNGRISSSCMSFGSQKLLSSWTRLTIRLVSDWWPCGGEKSVILPLHLFISLSLLKPLDLGWTMSWRWTGEKDVADLKERMWRNQVIQEGKSKKHTSMCLNAQHVRRASQRELRLRTNGSGSEMK